MILWIDAQLPPAIAEWLVLNCGVSALALRDIGLRDASDREIFLAARREGAIVVTKDSDFVRLVKELGPPPQLVWITCGNTSNSYLRLLLIDALPRIIELVEFGQAVIEIE